MLTRNQVISVYCEVLGRVPSDAEIDNQLNTVPTLDAMLRMALDSEEYAERQREATHANTPAVVNIFHPDLAPWGLPVGTRSDDGVAIVGHAGWLFLCGGVNANLGQYVGAVEMDSTWLDDWRNVLSQRRTELDALEVASAMLVVPDKLAVYEEHYPESLTRIGQRPIERLLAAELPIIYPLAELHAAAATDEEVYMKTDTHLTFRGNELLFRSIADSLGIEHLPDLTALSFNRYPLTGDLGSKFDPQIIGIVSEPASLHHAEITEDNRAEIAAVGGHIGTRRVFRNGQAPDSRVAVVFGDSFGFGDPSYQGLSWFMAQVFREVHFVWVPFGWDAEYVRSVGAKAVLIQGAERFAARVPHVEVKVARLAEETLQRKQPLGLDRAFD